MTQIRLETDISAPQQRCFDLARDAAFHVESARETGERIVNGKTAGLWEFGDEITFEGRHLGVKQRLSARIVEMDAPRRFVDEATRSVFVSLRHVHEFEVLPNGQTRMIDTLNWRSPLGILGVWADNIAVKSHLRKFLVLRGERLKARAEKSESG